MKEPSTSSPEMGSWLCSAPLGHEDHAQRACYTALAIQRDLTEYGQKIKKDFGQEFKMRIGLNSGPVVVGSIGEDLSMDYTAIGDTINLGARVQQAAAAGEVWLSHETRSLIQGYFIHEPMGEVTLKGKAEPQRLYRLIAEDQKCAHGLRPAFRGESRNLWAAAPRWRPFESPSSGPKARRPRFLTS